MSDTTPTRLNVIERPLLLEVFADGTAAAELLAGLAGLARAVGLERVRVEPNYLCCLPPEEYDWEEVMAPFYGIFKDLNARAHEVIAASALPFDWTRQTSDGLRWLPPAPEQDPFREATAK